MTPIEVRPRVIEVQLRLDLGTHGPANPDFLLLQARHLAVILKDEAEEMATTAAEASASEEVRASVPEVRYRTSELDTWRDPAKDEPEPL